MHQTRGQVAGGDPKISVCMAFRDGDDFIREAVDSVLAQSSAEWELLLFDDGSGDGGTAYAQELAATDPRVRYAQHPGQVNRGLAATRVACAAQARGEYLLFLDHDDRLWGDALERLAAVLDAQPAAAAVFAAARWWYGRDDHPKNADQSYLPWRSGMMHGRRVLRHMLLRDRPHPCVHATMFRRAEYIAASTSGPLREMIFEDAALLYKLLTRRDIYLLDEVVADYRIRTNSMSYTQDSRMAPFLRWVWRELPLDRISRACIPVRLAILPLVPWWHRLRRRPVI